MTVAKMLQIVKDRRGIKTDVSLCHQTGISQAQLSKMRSGALPVGPAALVKLHELTGMGTLELKLWIADPEGKK